MSLLDRIGKVLKGATESKPASTDTPKSTTTEGSNTGGFSTSDDQPTSTAKPATSTGGLFGGGEPTATTEKPVTPATAPATGTGGLFGGGEQTATTEKPATSPTAPATGTGGLFGGDSNDQPAATTDTPTKGTKGLFGDDTETPPTKAPKTSEPTGTKGLFGGADASAAAGVSSTAEKEAPTRKVQSDGPSSTVPQETAEARPEGILPVHPKVLMIVHNPTVESEGGKRLTEIFKWHDPEKLAKGYIEDLKTISDGYVNYEIVERIDADFFPPKNDGFAYTGDDYVKVMRQQAKPHDPDWLDYHARIEKFDLQNRFNNGDFDEVWFFSFPYAGEYESIMGGPGGFWCNAPAIKNTDRFKRKFVMMGFNMERGVDCMLENFGHRTESIMTELYKRRGKKQDMWKLFTQYEKQNPGDAQCGWMHYAPNSVKDYDWGNTTPVTSYCDDWYSYPDLPHEGKTMDNKTWGGGDMRKHHLWWFDHLPKTTGETDGISNNWWEYAVDPNKV